MSESRSTLNILSALDNNALDNHVALFTNEDRTYSPATVANGLQALHGHQPILKGTVIATFNASHASDNLICPMIHGQFVPDANTGYAKNLHLGTTRIWNADNTINEERWKKFADYVTKGQDERAEKIVTFSALNNYLDICAQEDPQESNTGRNAFGLFSSKDIQCLAARKGWEETFDRLTCGWVRKSNKTDELEPYITLSLVRQFFENSKEAFKKTKDGELPVAKPNHFSI